MFNFLIDVVFTTSISPLFLGSGYLDDDDDDDNDDNSSESNIDNNGYRDNLSSYKLQNSSVSMKFQSNSGRFLSAHTSQLLLPSTARKYTYRHDLQQKGVHVDNDNDNDYNDDNSDNYRALILFLIACCMLLVIGLLYLLIIINR